MRGPEPRALELESPRPLGAGVGALVFELGVCPECGSRLVESGGLLVCENCGLVAGGVELARAVSASALTRPPS